MTKIGRNQPCPCGSGQKHKKCCLREKKSTPASIPPAGNNVALADSDGSMPPYVIAKEFETSEVFAEMRRSAPAKAALFWTPSRVAALDTNSILQRLARLGVVTAHVDFQIFSETFTSAWSVSDLWRAKSESALPHHDDDFLGLAACELWKRYCPNSPSVEMLDDWMQEGYRFMMNLDAAQACDIWGEVWDVIRPRLKPKMRTCEQAASVFHGTQCLFNWIQDFGLELSNAAVDTSGYAADGVRLCEQVLGQFLDESPLFIRGFRADLGQFHFLAGYPDDGEQVLLDVIRDFPNAASSYARLADILAFPLRPGDEPIAPQRAQKILEEALARPVKDAAQYDLEERLRNIRSAAATSSILDANAAFAAPEE